jgi:hypothetical protein
MCRFEVREWPGVGLTEFAVPGSRCRSHRSAVEQFESRILLTTINFASATGLISVQGAGLTSETIGCWVVVEPMRSPAVTEMISSKDRKAVEICCPEAREMTLWMGDPVTTG